MRDGARVQAGRPGESVSSATNRLSAIGLDLKNKGVLQTDAPI